MRRKLPAPLRIIVDSFVDWWDDWIAIVVLNLVWALCWVTIILGPPATLALYYATNQVARGMAFDYKELIAIAEKYFLQSWLWALSNLVIVVILIVNVQFYGSGQAFGNVAIQELSIFLVAVWLIVQFYTLPYFIEQSDKRLRVAWQNSLFTLFKSPVYTLVLAVFTALVVAVSGFLIVPAFLGGPCLIAVLGNNAVRDRLEDYGVRSSGPSDPRSDNPKLR